MKNLILTIICLTVISLVSVLDAEEIMIIRFSDPSPQTVTEFTTNTYYVASYKPGHFLDLVVDVRLYNEIIDKGYDVEITQTESQLQENMLAGRDLEGYRTYEDLLTELQQLEVDYPELCKLYDIGDSRGKQYSDEGNSNYDDYYHEIWAFKLSDNVTEEEDEPGVFYIGEHHANETISLEVTMYILYHLLENYGTDPTITNNVDNTQIWFIPLVNPNGHKLVTDEDYIFWRKTIRDNDENSMITPATSFYNCPDGVDPNRNYGFQWGYVGTNSDNSNWCYNGPNAWSEPEVQAVKGFLDTHQFYAGLTYHSYGEYICSPYNYSKNIITPDHAALEEIMDEMAILTGYDAFAGIELFPIMGPLDDYAYGVHGTFCYTVELGTQFIPPYWYIENICEENIDAALFLLDRINHSSLTGHITDADTGDPLQAEIFIEGIDDVGVFRYPYISNEMYGTYYRLLTEGDYNVIVSAYGYVPQSFEDISIIGTDVTILDVALIPQSETFDVTGSVMDGNTGMPIENATIEILNCNIPSVTTDLNGEYIIPDLYPYDLEFKVYKNDYIVLSDEYSVSGQNNLLHFILYQIEDESFEDGELDSCWECEGNVDWFIDGSTAYEGTYSVRSGEASTYEYSDLLLTACFEQEGQISFYHSVSCQYNYDFFRFHIDNILMGEWSGNLGWDLASYPISSGIHTFKWSYIKNGSVNAYSDCVWIDNIVFAGSNSDDLLISGITVLKQNYPNPFNPSTEISYQVSGKSKVNLSIYNIKGQLVKNIINEFIPAGEHSIVWNGLNMNDKLVSSGIYFYKLKTNDYEKVRKMILLK